MLKTKIMFVKAKADLILKNVLHVVKHWLLWSWSECALLIILHGNCKTLCKKERMILIQNLEKKTSAIRHEKINHVKNLFVFIDWPRMASGRSSIVKSWHSLPLQYRLRYISEGKDCCTISGINTASPLLCCCLRSDILVYFVIHLPHTLLHVHTPTNTYTRLL